MTYSNIDYQNILSEKVAMYGGSFNPIHKGHIQLAEYFVKELNLDRLLIVPDRTPPHKSDKAMVSPLHRYNMCKIAVQNFPKIEVSDIEINRTGKSYTVDTLRQLKSLYPKAQLFLIMGEDMFLSLHTWREYREIFNTAIICALPREHDNLSPILHYAKQYEAEKLRFIVSDAKVVQISSTEIRESIRQGLPLSDMLEEKVAEYIVQYSLYRGDDTIEF